MTTVDRKMVEHKEHLIVSRDKTIMSIFEHAEAVYNFWKDCQEIKTWGADTFGEKIWEWLGYNPSTASYWKNIGINKDKFLKINHADLPQSMRSLYELSSLTPEQIAECLEPQGCDTAQQDIVAFKRELNGKTKPVAKDVAVSNEIAVGPQTTMAEVLPPASSPPINEPIDITPSGPADEAKTDHKGEIEVLAMRTALRNEMMLLVNAKISEVDVLLHKLLNACYHPANGVVRKDDEHLAKINYMFQVLANGNH